jgi:hypothetical protein
MRWVDEIANRERTEELFFRKEIFLIRWFDYLIWSADFYLITSSFNSSCMNDSTSNRICLFETIRIVNFFINLLTSNRVVLRSFNRDDLFKSRWFFSYLLISRSSKDQWARRWVCDSDEIRSKWQQNSKTSWSEENNLETIEDLDSQKDLDKSWDERSINEIVEREFLYNEVNFSSKLKRQQLAIHSFVNQ